MSAVTDEHRDAAWVIVREHTHSDAQSSITRAIAEALAAAEQRGAERAGKAVEALREIRDMEPDNTQSTAMLAKHNNDDCSECAAARKRHWPPSGLCEKHYCEVSDAHRQAEFEHRQQQSRMRDIARDALAQIEAALALAKENGRG